MRRQDFAPVKAACLLAMALGGLLAAGPAGGSPYRLLVVTAAQDTSGAFQSVLLPELGRRVLVWDEGVLSLPDSALWLDDHGSGLAFAVHGATLVGVGGGGRFRIQPGRYDLDTPLLLTDGALVAYLSAGKLEVGADRLVYRRPQKRRDSRGDLFILGGVVLATAVLLRAVRQRTRRS